jgi:PAS domain S-box-containing protein
VVKMNNAAPRKILLVDDDAVTAMAESEALRGNGYEVMTACSSGEGIDAVRLDPSIDLVLLDINPVEGIDGADAAKRILALRNLPIVVLASHSERKLVEKVRSITRYGYVIKNSGDFVLLSSIEMAFELFGAHRNVEKEIEERRRAEDRFRLILDTTPFPIAVVDQQDNNINFWSRSALDIFGHTAPTASEWYQIAYPDPEYRREVIDRWKPFLEIARKSGETVNTGEYRVACSDGTIRICELFATFIPDSLIVTFNDITERKKAEEALRLKNLVFDVSIAAKSIADLDGVIREANDSFLRAWGYQHKDEVIGRPFAQFLNDPREAVAIVTSLCTDGRWEGDYTAKKKDGSTFIARGMATIIRDEKGALIGHQSAVMDVTVQREAEKELERHRDHLEQIVAERTAELKESEEKFRTVADFTYNWEYWLDNDRRMLYVSPSCERISGFPPERFSGDPQFISTLIHPDDRHVFEEHVRIHHIHGHSDESCEIEFRIIDKSGNMRWIAHGCRPVTGMDGNYRGRRVTNRDITERKRVEQERDELLKKVEQRSLLLESANKELESFSYSVSHDLRAPLRHISGFVELLTRRFRPTLPEKAQHYLDSIADSAHEMGTLIDTLLQFSRTGRSEMRQSHVDMHEIVLDVVKSLCKDNPDRSIEWTIAKLPSVHGDNSLLRLVWMNLLANAVKFTRTREKARIEIGIQEEKEEFIFFVRDNGVGFDMRHAQKLFGVFQRLHPTGEFEGTGIGLANVHRIIARHGGRTWAESEPDKGAAFYFSLSR